MRLSKSAVASAAALTIVGGSAFAYFANSTTVSGSGTATVGTAAPTSALELSATANAPIALTNVVGGTAVTTFTVAAKNPSTNPVSVPANVKVTMQVMPANETLTCPAGSFEVGTYNTNDVTVVPAGATVDTGSVAVTFHNLENAEQTGCLGATVKLSFETAAPVVPVVTTTTAVTPGA